MSAVGVVAAAGCIGTGVFALNSDVLPFSGWSGDKDRPDGRQLLPDAARVRQLASVQASPLSPDTLAPAIFVSTPSGVRPVSATVASARQRSAAPTVSARRTGASHRSTPGGTRRGGDVRQRTADAPTTAAPSAPATAAVAAVASAPAAGAAPAPAPGPTRQQASVPSRSVSSDSKPRKHDDGDRHGDHGRRNVSSSSTGDRSSASTSQPAPVARHDEDNGRRGGRGGDDRGHDDRGHGNDKRQAAQAPAQPQAQVHAQSQPAPAAPAAPARHDDDHGDDGRHGDGGRGHGDGDRGRAAAVRPAAPAPAAPAPAPAAAPAAAPAPAPQAGPQRGNGQRDGGHGHDGRH